MKFIFDASISFRIAEALAILSPDQTITSVADHFKDAAIADEDFLPELQQEGTWAVLTQDRGQKDGNWHVWRASGVTTVFLKKGWMSKSQKTKASDLLRYWPEIVRQVERHPEGTCFWLSTKGRVEPIK